MTPESIEFISVSITAFSILRNPGANENRPPSYHNVTVSDLYFYISESVADTAQSFLFCVTSSNSYDKIYKSVLFCIWKSKNIFLNSTIYLFI